MTIAKLEHVGVASLFLGVSKLLAAAIVAFTGVVLIRDANDVEKAKSANEKVRIALTLYVLGIVCLIVGLAFDANLPEIIAAGLEPSDDLVNRLGQLSLLKDQIFYNVFCLVCLPALTLLTFALKRCLDTGKSTVLFKFMLVLATILTLVASLWGVLGLYSFLFG